MKVELRRVEDIRPYEGNPRQNDDAVDAVAASIREFGFRVPIVVDAAGVIIAGHTRWKASQKLGLETVPVHVAEGLTPEQVRAYRLADNATQDLAEWDYELLPIEVGALKDCGFDLGLLGFDETALGRILDAGGPSAGLTDPDDVPEPPDEAVTQPGDLWILGEHRLLCGDSASDADVDRLLAGAPIQLANCDPPYGVNVSPRSSTAVAAGNSAYPDLSGKMHTQGFDAARGVTDPHKAKKKMRAKDRPLVNDFLDAGQFETVLQQWFDQIGRVLEPGRAFYLWAGWTNIKNYPAAMERAGLHWSQCLIWNKQHPVLTRLDYMLGFEICFYGWSAGAAHQFFGPNNLIDVWNVKKIPPQQMSHLTEKPVELAVRAIQASSRPGENVLDLFGGSGSTLIGCEQTGRKAFLMEIDTLYADIIVQRWEKFTGRKADRIEAEKEEKAA